MPMFGKNKTPRKSSGATPVRAREYADPGASLNSTSASVDDLDFDSADLSFGGGGADAALPTFKSEVDSATTKAAPAAGSGAGKPTQPSPSVKATKSKDSVPKSASGRAAELLDDDDGDFDWVDDVMKSVDKPGTAPAKNNAAAGKKAPVSVSAAPGWGDEFDFDDGGDDVFDVSSDFASAPPPKVKKAVTEAGKKAAQAANEAPKGPVSAQPASAAPAKANTASGKGNKFNFEEIFDTFDDDQDSGWGSPPPKAKAAPVGVTKRAESAESGAQRSETQSRPPPSRDTPSKSRQLVSTFEVEPPKPAPKPEKPAFNMNFSSKYDQSPRRPSAASMRSPTSPATRFEKEWDKAISESGGDVSGSGDGWWAAPVHGGENDYEDNLTRETDMFLKEKEKKRKADEAAERRAGAADQIALRAGQEEGEGQFLMATDVLELDLSHRRMEEAPGLRSFSRLLVLDLSHVGLSSISDCLPPSLVKLQLSNNNLVAIEGIGEMCDLEWLDISHNAIRKVAGLEGNPKLKHLSLAHNNIKCLVNVEHLLHLHTIDLSHNSIASFESVRLLSVLTSLKVIGFEGNPAGINKNRTRVVMKNFLPRLEVMDDHKYTRYTTKKVYSSSMSLDSPSAPNPSKGVLNTSILNASMRQRPSMPPSPQGPPAAAAVRASMAPPKKAWSQPKPKVYASAQKMVVKTVNDAYTSNDAGWDLHERMAAAQSPRQPPSPAEYVSYPRPVTSYVHNPENEVKTSPRKGVPQSPGADMESASEVAPSELTERTAGTPDTDVMKRTPSAAGSARVSTKRSPAKQTPKISGAPRASRATASSVLKKKHAESISRAPKRTPAATSRSILRGGDSSPPGLAAHIQQMEQHHQAGQVAAELHNAQSALEQLAGMAGQGSVPPGEVDALRQSLNQALDITKRLAKPSPGVLDNSTVTSTSPSGQRTVGFHGESHRMVGNGPSPVRMGNMEYHPLEGSWVGGGAVALTEMKIQQYVTEFTEELLTTRTALTKLVQLSEKVGGHEKIMEFKQLLHNCNLFQSYELPMAVLTYDVSRGGPVADGVRQLKDVANRLNGAKSSLERFMTLLELEPLGSVNVRKYREHIIRTEKLPKSLLGGIPVEKATSARSLSSRFSSPAKVQSPGGASRNRRTSSMASQGSGWS